jgi:oxygen-independent coproporphyrinogen-3 oxidase
MGIETLDPNLLHAINRRHDQRQAENAIGLLLSGGLVVNVDLMYGFPGQTEATFIADLDVAAAWGVPSISVYNLRLNEHTPLERVVDDLERLDLPRLVHWRAMIRREMEARGYEQVRWHTYVKRTGVPSTFGRAPCVDGSGPGRQLGVGVSAVSHLGAQVYRNRANLDEYLTCIEENATPVDGLFTLDDADRWTLLLVRTLGDGRPLARASWVEAFGRSIDEDLGPLLTELIDAELVGSDDESLFLTDTGRLVYDLITLAFHPHRARRWLAERQSVGWEHRGLGATS